MGTGRGCASYNQTLENGAGRLKSLVSQRHYLSVLLFILAAKALFWSWSLAVGHWFPLSPLKYFATGHHYTIDPRITEHRVDFFTLWTYADSEWYLSIAEHGYPNTDEMNKAAAARKARTGFPYAFSPGDPAARYRKYTEWDNDAKYAFFPLYPLSIALFRLILPLDVAAFVATNAISTLAFLGVYALAFAYFSDKGLAFRSLASGPFQTINGWMAPYTCGGDLKFAAAWLNDGAVTCCQGRWAGKAPASNSAIDSEMSTFFIPERIPPFAHGSLHSAGVSTGGHPPA